MGSTAVLGGGRLNRTTFSVAEKVILVHVSVSGDLRLLVGITTVVVGFLGVSGFLLLFSFSSAADSRGTTAEVGF